MEKIVAHELAIKLLQIKAIKLSPQNPFIWASGLRSPIYCDNRLTLSHTDVRTYIKKHLASEAIANFKKFHAISGVATAGIAHGALLADFLDLPFSYVRSKAKTHGRQNKIEGEINKNHKILVVEDLISTGMSSIAAVDAVRDAGAEVVGVIAIFSYGFEKAQVAFDEARCPYITLSNYSALIDEALKSGYINKEEKIVLKAWNKNPLEWSRAMN